MLDLILKILKEAGELALEYQENIEEQIKKTDTNF